MQRECSSHKKKYILICLLLAMAAATNVHSHGTRAGFYSKTCPNAEAIVKSMVQSHVNSDPTLAAGLLRLHFHDCFVRGCDASVLISGFGTERTAAPNLSLRGFEVVDDAKAALEAACPGVVSCADILALAARDSVVLTGGKYWKVPTGRRDGRLSVDKEAMQALPSPDFSVEKLRKIFAKMGLNLKDLVTLAGGHTLGTANCTSFEKRLYHINGTGPDPSISPSFLRRFREHCPRNSIVSTRVALDTGSQNKFDTSYFANLKKGGGVLYSDRVLWTDASTKGLVEKYIEVECLFNYEFGKSMIKMGNIGVKTGSNGEIRKKCSAIN